MPQPRKIEEIQSDPKFQQLSESERGRALEMLRSKGMLVEQEQAAILGPAPASQAAPAASLKTRQDLAQDPKFQQLPPAEQERAVGMLKEKGVLRELSATEHYGGAVAQGLSRVVSGAMRGAAVMREVAPRVIKPPIIARSRLSELIQLDSVEEPFNAKESLVFQAGERLQNYVSQVFPSDPRKQEEFATKVAGGLGTAAGYLATGIIPFVGPYVATTGGALDNAYQSYVNAQEKMAPQEKADAAALWGLATGSTEAIPFIRGIKESVVRFGEPVLKRVWQAVKRGAIEEGLQEGVQQTLDNVGAILLYDKDRKLFQDALENAGVGGVVGAASRALLSGVFGIRWKTAKRVEDLYDQKVLDQLDAVHKAANPDSIGKPSETAFVAQPGLSEVSSGNMEATQEHVQAEQSEIVSQAAMDLADQSGIEEVRAAQGQSDQGALPTLARFRTAEHVMREGGVESTKVFEAGRDYVGNSQRDFGLFIDQYRKSTEGMTPGQKLVVLEALDNFESAEELPSALKGDAGIYKAFRDTRELLDNVHQYMTERGVKVGYLSSFLPHVMNGKYWIDPNVEGRSAIPARSLNDAEAIMRKMLDSKEAEHFIEGAEPSIWQDSSVNVDDSMGLPRRQFYRLLGNLQSAVRNGQGDVEVLTKEDVKDLLNGVVRPAMKKRFFGNILQRVKDNPNYIKDLDSVMEFYIYGAVRKAQQDAYLKTSQEALEAMPAEKNGLRKYITNLYEPKLLGYPSDFEKNVARSINNLGGVGILPRKVQNILKDVDGLDLRHAVRGINQIQYVMDLGYSVISAFANLTQQANTAALVGTNSWAVGAANGSASLLGNKNLAKELSEMNVLTGVSPFTGEMIARKSGSKIQNSALFMFQQMENYNRAASYFAGKNYGLKKLKSGKRSAAKIAESFGYEQGRLKELAQAYDAEKNQGKKNKLREEFAKQFGFEMVDKTQFRTGRENMPFILNNEYIRLVAPYKGFITKQLAFQAQTFGAAFRHPSYGLPRALRLLALSSALGGAAVSPFIASLYNGADWLAKELFGFSTDDWLKKQGLYEGVAPKVTKAATGTSMSIEGSTKIMVPMKPEDVLGRFGKTTLKLGEHFYHKYSGVSDLAKVARSDFALRQAERQILPAEVQRVIDGIKIYREGMYKSGVSGYPVAIEGAEPGSPEALKLAVGRVLGAMPMEVAQHYNADKVARSTIEEYNEAIRSMNQALLEGNLKGVMDSLIFAVDSAGSKMQSPRLEDQLNALTLWTLVDGFVGSNLAKDGALMNELMRKELPAQWRALKDLPTAGKLQYLREQSLQAKEK